MTALGTITGAVSVAVGSGEPVEVATFEVPIATTVVATEPGAARLVAHVGPATLGSAIADTLRQLADRIDPDVHDLPEPELLPGAQILHCPDCDATAIGGAGDSIEHADNGAHVHHTTYGDGT
jgi:hypothetical protein